MDSAKTDKPRCPVCRKEAEWRETTIAEGHRFGCWVTPCNCEIPTPGRTAKEMVLGAMITAGVPKSYIELRRSPEWALELLPPSAVAMADNTKRRHGLVLLGKIGTGKTVAGCYILERWIVEGMKRCRYVHLPTVATRRDRNDQVEILMASKLVHVDDLGYQKAEASGWVFSLVDGLYRAAVPVVYTTSRTENQIRQSLAGYETAEAVLDRLRGCEIVEVTRQESMRGK